MRIASLLVAASACAVGACSPDRTPAPQPAAQAAPPARAAAPAPTVLDDQMRALQKAHDVQKTMDQRDPDIDKQVKDSGG